ncbi:MAG: PorP/SprF family type IX secretion system membrane protein [Sphingobacteriaceae bacterium]|nr:PorP/SprF family type IX secretion system membrane protein [Sphingobacteriaceae bacterium]
MRTLINKSIRGILLVQGLAFTAFAQNTPSFTQYMNNLTPFNTAYSSLDEAGNANLVARKQFVGIDDAPSTFLFNGSMPIKSIKGTAGIIIRNDNMKPENLTDLNAFFSKSVQISSKSFFATSVSVGFRNYKVDNVDASDPSFTNSPNTDNKANVGLGVMIYSNNYYVGASLPRFNLSKADRENKYYTNMYYLTAGYLKQLGADFKIKPAALLAYTDNIPAQLDLSTTFYVKDTYGLGVNYRSNNELSFIASLVANSNLQVGYSYQFGFGEGQINNATHEVTLGYRFGKKLLPKFL